MLNKVVNFIRRGQFFVPGLMSWPVQPVKPIKTYQNLSLDGSSILYPGREFDGLDQDILTVLGSALRVAKQ